MALPLPTANGFLIHLRLILLLFIPVLLAPSAEVELVRSRLPALYEASVQIWGNERAEEFFGAWDVTDIEFFEERTRAIYKKAKFLTQPPFTAEDLLKLDSGTLIGVLGEIDGRIYMRSQLDLASGQEFISEDDYRKLNPDTKLHDGLVVIQTPGRVTIIHVLECKMGKATFDRKQVVNDASQKGRLGYLVHWQVYGMSLPSSSDLPHYYDPDQIYLRQLDSATGTISDRQISDIDGSDLERSTTLIGTGNGPESFLGTYRETTLNPMSDQIIPIHEYQELTISLLEKLTGSSSKDAPSPRIRPKRISGTSLEHYLKRLEDYVWEFGHLPKTSVGEFGAILSKEMTKRGGRTHAFVFDISIEAQHHLVSTGNAPIPHSFVNQLLMNKPYTEAGEVDPQVLSALVAYLHAYETRDAPVRLVPTSGGGTDITSVISPLITDRVQALNDSIVGQLTSKGKYPREWWRFFSQLSPEIAQAIGAAPDVEGCAGGF